MALSAAQHVELIDTAIQSILSSGVSSYSIGNRSATKLDLPALYEQRKYWAAMAQRESSGMFRLAKMSRPSR